MTQIDGREVLKAIHYVRDLYCTAARMLLAADGLVADQGWVPHGAKWKPIPWIEASLASTNRWMPHYVIRQYRREQGSETETRELLTVGVIPYDPVDQRIEEPLCLASRMRHRTDGDEVYWLPLQQLRLKGGIGPLGMVRRIHRDDLEFKPRRVANFAECVEGDELLSIAVPLVTVVDEQALLAQVLAPILAAAYAVTIPAGAGALGARQS